MNDLFEKAYNLYEILLMNLKIGHSLSNSNFSELWELIQLMDFVKFGNPTEDELLWISDKYEIIEITHTNLEIED